MRAGGRLRAQPVAVQQEDAQADQRDADHGHPDRQVRRLRQLRRDQQHAEHRASAAASSPARRRGAAHGSRAAPNQRMRQCAHADPSPGNSASAVSAARRWSRPCSGGQARPGQRQRERPRRALGGQHPRRQARQARLDGQRRAAVACHASVTGPPPPAPSNSFVYQPRAARDGLPRDALRRIAALVLAQAGEVGVVARPLRERVGAAVAARQRRRTDLRRRIHDAREREVDVRPAAPQPERMVGRQRDASERHASRAAARGRRA